jgi:hypothetical protein
MTQDEIIEMAESCGWDKGNTWDDCMRCSPFNIEDFAKLVAQKEREACAWVCDSLEEQCEKLLVPDEKWPTPSDCANIIRARGQA